MAQYVPSNDAEKALDKRINRKLDFTVLLVLAIGFILCGIDKTNVGFVATTTFVEDAKLKPDDIPTSLSLVNPEIAIVPSPFLFFFLFSVFFFFFLFLLLPPPLLLLSLY